MEYVIKQCPHPALYKPNLSPLKRKNMNPKDKAAELVEKFRLHNSTTQDENYKLTKNYSISVKYAIQCAIICVEEILKAEPLEPNETYDKEKQFEQAEHFWQSVLTELKAMA